jgi:hypothetical protein
MRINMIKHFFIALIFFLPGLAWAEKLIFPMFPDKGVWTFIREYPVSDLDGTTVGQIKFYRLSSDENTGLSNLLMVTWMNRNPLTSPTDHFINSANALQKDCENLNITPLHQYIEHRVPLTYGRVYCTNSKDLNKGFIQSIKVMQGRSKLFIVTRQWYTPPFRMPIDLSDRNLFAKSIFKSEELASSWLNEFDLTKEHLLKSVTLCAESPEEFGNPCDDGESAI